MANTKFKKILLQELEVLLVLASLKVFNDNYKVKVFLRYTFSKIFDG